MRTLAMSLELRSRCRPFALAVLAVIAFAPGARADEPAAPAPTPTPGPVGKVAAENDGNDYGDWLVRRSHTLAEAEVGVIALPNAPISTGQRGGNLPYIGTIGHGDATLLAAMHLIYRGGRDWALGAGAAFAPFPTSDNQYGGNTGLPRSHQRSYLSLGAEGRYIPLHFRSVEGWVGVTVGTVVVADRFTTSTGDLVPPILGSKQVTVRTEGGTVGLQAGGDWLFAERLLVGFALRVDHWILPTTANCTSLGDCATLTGPVSEVQIGIRFGYRIPL